MMANQRDDRDGVTMATENDGATTIARCGDTAVEKLAFDARREREESERGRREESSTPSRRRRRRMGDSSMAASCDRGRSEPPPVVVEEEEEDANNDATLSDEINDLMDEIEMELMNDDSFDAGARMRDPATRGRRTLFSNPRPRHRHRWRARARRTRTSRRRRQLWPRWQHKRRSCSDQSWQWYVCIGRIHHDFRRWHGHKLRKRVCIDEQRRKFGCVG